MQLGNGSAMKYYFMQIANTWPTMHYIPLVIVYQWHMSQQLGVVSQQCRTACQFSVPVFDHKSGATSIQKLDIIVTCIWSMTHSPMLSSITIHKFGCD